MRRLLLLWLLASPLAAQPLPVIHFSQAPYSHTQLNAPAISYSGQTIVHVQQWGAYSLNPFTGAFTMVSPVGKTLACTQTPHFVVTGDCWQSATEIAASPGAEKWVVVLGAPNSQCSPNHGQFQVLRLDGGLRWVGEIFALNVGYDAPSIDGDFAYAKEGGQSSTYTKVDLNALTVVATGLTSRPTWTPQPSIGGYTYVITNDTNPQVCGAQQHFVATRGGGATSPTPTAPPGPTPTPAPNQFAQQIEAVYRAGITAGCGGGNFCPTRTMTRQEVAAWLAIALKLPLLPCQGVFTDVPCSPVPK